MTILEASVHTPLALALGWSLVHFLWEGALIALALAVLLFVCGPASARLRYALCCLAMVAMPLAFGITLALALPGPHDAAVLALPDRPPQSPGDWLPFAGGTRPLAEQFREALPWLAPFWMAGMLVVSIGGLGGWMAVERLRRTGVCQAPAEWRERLGRLRGRLHFAKHVALLESCLIDVPVAIGFLRPTILMPVGILMGLSTSQVESILIHELAHIRRRDYLVNVLQKFVECVLFYHPAVWWVSGLVRAERENCCDDVVVELNGDARGYAAALATLEKNRWPAGDPALAATGGSLMQRIHRLIRQPERPRTAAAPILAAGLLVVSLAVALGGWQAQPQQPAATTLQANETPYHKWVTEDVAYIITDAERKAFKDLQTDEEREMFIEQFWLRRDPTPGTPENEFKEEHYRRIAYANQHFAANKIAGWKTDRGRIYITYGPPDEIESHPSGGSYERPAAEGGGTTSTVPFEQWRYRYIEGIGTNIIIEFVDPTMTGEYRMTLDPNEKDAVKYVSPPSPSAKGFAKVQVLRGAAVLSVPLAAYGNQTVVVSFRITSMTGRPVAKFADTVHGPAPAYTRFLALPAGVYRFAASVTDTSGAEYDDEVGFEVK